jgi:hypothetical protein
MAAMKAFACVSLLAFAITAQPAFAQSGSTPAPSPLKNAPGGEPRHYWLPDFDTDPAPWPQEARESAGSHVDPPRQLTAIKKGRPLRGGPSCVADMLSLRE